MGVGVGVVIFLYFVIEFVREWGCKWEWESFLLGGVDFWWKAPPISKSVSEIERIEVVKKIEKWAKNYKVKAWIFENGRCEKETLQVSLESKNRLQKFKKLILIFDKVPEKKRNLES